MQWGSPAGFRLRALTEDSRDKWSILVSMCVYVHACGSIFFFLGKRLPACVLVCAYVRVLGQDQWSKSTLERVAQWSSPTYLSLPPSVSLISPMCPCSKFTES